MALCRMESRAREGLGRRRSSALSKKYRGGPRHFFGVPRIGRGPCVTGRLPKIRFLHSHGPDPANAGALKAPAKTLSRTPLHLEFFGGLRGFTTSWQRRETDGVSHS